MKDDLTTAGVAKYLGISRITAKRLMPKVPGAYKISLATGEPAKNSPWRVSKAKLDEFITRAKYSVGSAKYETLQAGWHK